MKHICEFCEKEFNHDEIKFIPFSEAIHGNIGIILVHNIKTNQTYFTSKDQIRDGDHIFHCPYCGRVHLFGMSLAGE